MIIDERAQANMDVILDQICAQLPNGGDHESRKFIAERLMKSASAGNYGLRELGAVARRAMLELRNRERPR